MPNQLTLAPDADAPAHARRWVSGQLHEIGRPELVEAASLGVSELVTNAVLHAGGGIAVRLSDTQERLRVEVYDDSPAIPGRPANVGVGQDSNPSTVGRGLQILDAISLAWGVNDEQGGKCVWFQPSAVGLPMRAGGGGPLMSAVPHPSASTQEDDQFEVVLLGLPVMLFAHYRTRLHDLRRELTLMSLDDGPRHGPSTSVLARTTRQHEQHGHQVETLMQIDDAIAAGFDRVDVRLELNRAALPEIVLLRDVLRELSGLSGESRLLTLAPGPQERAIWEWYFNEILGQAAAAEPQPWRGAYHVTDPDPLAD